MKNFRKVVALFKSKFPEYRLSVRRLPLSQDLYGDCREQKKNKYLIRIRKDLPEDQAIETFLHEFAHVLAWGLPGDDHGNGWGKAYSKVYRLFLKEFVETS